MIIDEILTPPACKMAGANPLYDQLLAYVETKYSDKPTETRAIIFALAYTKACHTKKININDTCILQPSTADEAKSNKRTIQTLVKSACYPSNFETMSREASSVFETLRAETLTFATNAFASSVAADVRVSVGEIVRPLLPPQPPPEPTKFWKFVLPVWHLLAASFHHALLIFFAGLYFILIGIGLNKAGTTVVPYLWTLVEETFKPMQGSTQDKTPANSTRPAN